MARYRKQKKETSVDTLQNGINTITKTAVGVMGVGVGMAALGVGAGLASKL